MHIKFGRNPSNGVEVMRENVKKNLGKFGKNLDYHPPPTFRPPPQTAEAILTKKIAAHLQYILRLPTKFGRIRFSRFGQTRGERNFFNLPI